MTDKGQCEFFEDPNEMKDWLFEIIEKNARYKRRTFIYAHNMEYDWYAVMKDDLINNDILYIVFRPFISIYKFKGYFLDSMAFFRMSLKMVGETIGLPKMELPKDPSSIEEIKPYLKRDTEIVLKAMQEIKKYVNELGYNPRKLLTAGQLAITSFMTFTRRNGSDWFFTEYNREKKIMQIVKCKNVNLVREAFRGGNNTAFQIGRFENCTAIDINSLYPYAMTKMPFPNLRSEAFFKDVTMEQLLDWLDKFIGVCRCKIKAPIMENPYLPIRYAGYTTFPSDRILRGTWTFVEIKKALSLGYEIIEIEHCITWKKAPMNPLKRFIEELYPLKANGNAGKKLVIKLIMNNLYGKFAQYKKNKDYKLINRNLVREYLEKGYQIKNKIEEKYVMVKINDTYDPSYTNPILSAYITAVSRDIHWDAMNKISEEDRIYCDTDSIIVKDFEKYKEHFEINNELGGWKIEDSGDCKVLGEKRYYINNNIKISGISKAVMNEEIEIRKDGTVKITKKGINCIDNQEDIDAPRMVGIKDGLFTGSMDSVGSFRENKVEMKEHCKRMLYMPNEIDEVKIFLRTEI